VADNATALATLIFAALAAIGSLIRCYQNQRYWNFVNKRHSEKKKKKKS
jgi:hypothetical protein